MIGTKSFLDLPQEQRIKIYRLSGLTRPCPIDLIKESRRKSITESVPELQKTRYPLPDCRFHPYPLQQRTIATELPQDFECYCDPLPLQLLLLCRNIHDEGLPVLFGQNVFKVSWSHEGCHNFDSLNAKAQASITSLQVNFGRYDAVSGESLGLFEEFGSLLTRLSRSCNLTKLDLALDWGDSNLKDLGRKPPLLLDLSKLKSCTVRLSKSPNSLLNKLARDMVIEATTDKNIRDGGFQIMGLPKELRLRILSHTDLVARWRPGWWSDGLSIEDGKLVLDGSARQCCNNCAISRAICCCPKLGASYSTTCTCFTFPSEVFSVSHQFATDAREVFLLRNRFIFRGHPAKTLSFLCQQPPELLKLIQTIDFQFTHDDPGWWSQSSDATESWQNVISFLSRNLNLPNLSLTIDAGVAYEIYQEWTITEMHLDHVLDFYRSIVTPLKENKQFTSLRSFHVFLPCFHHFETEAEKSVKGSDYDSAKDGKIPFTKRNPYFPHGVPDPSLEWEDGMEL